MTHARRHAIRHYITATLIGVVASQLFVFLNGRNDPWDYVAGVFIALLITAAMYVFEHRIQPRTRRLTFIGSLASHILGWIVVIATSFCLGIALARMLQLGWGPFDSRLHRSVSAALMDRDFTRAYGWALTVILLIGLHGELSRKLGPGVLRNWILGRYRRPRSEERIFMFLDLKGSTALAEQLGDFKFSELVRDFFADITPAIVETRGEISHFIGDEVVVSWPMLVGLEDSNCVRCPVLARGLISAEEYMAKFGVMPEFRAGLHCGRVIATEVGTIKSEIVYHGDTVNTAARIQGICSETGIDVLLSRDLAERLPAVETKSLGTFSLKGKEEPLQLFGIA